MSDETLDQLDGIALRLFGPRTYADLNAFERACCAWQSLRETAANFVPPVDVGPMPENWRP